LHIENAAIYNLQYTICNTLLPRPSTVARTLHIVFAKDEKQNQHWDSVEHRANQYRAQIVGLLKAKKRHADRQRHQIRLLKKQQWLGVVVPRTLKLQDRQRQQGPQAKSASLRCRSMLLRSSYVDCRLYYAIYPARYVAGFKHQA
jgi:hypothetical protein